MEQFKLQINGEKVAGFDDELTALCEAHNRANNFRNKQVILLNYDNEIIDFRKEKKLFTIEKICEYLFTNHYDSFSFIKVKYPEIVTFIQGDFTEKLPFDANDLLKGFCKHNQLSIKVILDSCNAVGFSITETMVKGWFKSKTSRQYRLLSNMELMLILSIL